jgi:hypothetical protein
MSIPRKKLVPIRSKKVIEVINKKVLLFIFVVKMTEFMVIFGSEAESRPEWTRMVDVVYGSEGGELGFPSVAQ